MDLRYPAGRSNRSTASFTPTGSSGEGGASDLPGAEPANRRLGVDQAALAPADNGSEDFVQEQRMNSGASYFRLRVGDDAC